MYSGNQNGGLISNSTPEEQTTYLTHIREQKHMLKALNRNIQ